MRYSFRGSMANMAAVLSLAAVGMMGQTARIPRMPDGHPNLNGIWQTMNTADWDLEAHAAGPSLVVDLGAEGAEPGGLSVVEGGTIPYLPAALEKKKQNYANRLKADPEIRCYLPGVPRATYLPYPFQIFQSASAITIAYEYDSAFRNLYLKDPGPAPADSWMGQSVAHWDHDTLVVDVTGMDERTWLDRAGDFHSDALHVVERYTPVNEYIINYEATIEDAKVFSRPWKISMPLYKHTEKNAQLLEFKCVEFVEDLMYGKYKKEPDKK
ncbi:MAG TPA: hypothetical protein VK419_17760 [Bryobacteraceae bacterium]|nr:hypothetical protein [Bryobacteraceae bacterium]